MEYVTLGRTELRVSVAGLGCGGFSQLGLAQGKTEDHAIAVIRQAIDLGVNLFDTAAAYGTEAVLGRAIKSVRREEVVITTKAPFSFSNPHSTPEGIVASLDKSLRQLDTNYVDVYQLHGVPPNAYEHALNELAPMLLREKEKGKLRYLGITETAPHDPEHQTLHRAAQDGVWDVVMVGFHMMHQNARERVFPLTRANRIGILLMFMVRKIFSRPELLRTTIRNLVAAGELPQWLIEVPDPFAFLLDESGASTITEQPIVLFGTSRASMSCYSAPVTPSISAPILPRSSSRHCPSPIASSSPPYSVIWSASV